MTGKNFSANNLGQRRKSDFYETPYSLTRLLLDRVSISGSVLEPACGDGAIVKVLRERGIDPVAYDIRDGVDFLSEGRIFDVVITNPPFSIASEFTHKAISVASSDVFLLLPLSYLHGKGRHDGIYRRYCNLKTVYVFTRYPMLGDALREDGKHRTGMMVYAWFHFDMSFTGLPTVDWIDNDEFVLRRDTA